VSGLLEGGTHRSVAMDRRVGRAIRAGVCPGAALAAHAAAIEQHPHDAAAALMALEEALAELQASPDPRRTRH
jgi:ABC-type nitrate/sulfonate/bicarbonate transport system substrate-binding protein